MLKKQPKHLLRKSKLVMDIDSKSPPSSRPIQGGHANVVRQSHAQCRLWFLHQLNPEQAQHNLLFRLSLAGPALDAAKLQAAFAEIIRRHSVLRTCYRNSSSGPEQLVLTSVPFEILTQDLTELTPSQQTHRVEQLLHCELQTPFDLGNGPVIRGLLLHLGPDRQELIYTVHHIAFDGRSQEIFLIELAQLYEARTTEVLAPVPLQYGNFAAWEPSYLTSELSESTLAFWSDYLARMPTLIDFVGRTRAEGPTRPAHHRFIVSPELAVRLKAAAKSRGQTSFTTLIALFSVWIQYLSGHNRFLIGTDVHGRDFPELADVIGFFINQLVIKCDLSGDPTLGELLQRSHVHTSDALAHRQLPFDMLVAALAPQREHNRTPFFQVKLNYQRYQFPVDRLGEARIVQTQILQDMAGFDLVLDLTHGPTGIEAILEYDRQLFSTEEIERLSSLWLDLISHCETVLDHPLSRLHEMLQQWENTHLQHQQLQHQQRNRARLMAARKRIPIS